MAGDVEIMSEYSGRIAVGVVIVLVVSVAFAFELNYFLPANVSTLQSTSTGSRTTASTVNGTSWFGNEAPPTNCGNMTVGVHGWQDGYEIAVYVSSTPPGTRENPLGGNVCIYTNFQNVDNKSTSLPSGESVAVTNVAIVGNDTSEWSGIVFFRSECAVPASYSGSFGPNSTGWNCSMIWNTGRPYNGILANTAWPDSYVANATVHLSNSSTVFDAPASFSFTAGSAAMTTTTAASTNPTFYCGGPIFRLLTPVQNGSLYLKVVTDQGSVITNNGTVFVTHTAPPTAGISGGTANHCLRLEGNATGYLELAANDSLPTVGSYNLTLFAGYGQGPGYQGTIPSFTVQPNTTVYVTISVPSGEVTVVSCAQGSNCSTTTTTATTFSGDP
jgi:hypothetical protein